MLENDYLDFSNLAPKQAQALTMWLACSSIYEISQKMSIKEETIRSWLLDKNIKQIARVSMGRMFDSACAELTLNSQNAANELNKIINDPETPQRVKITAISCLFSVCTKLRDWSNQEVIENLEQRVLHENHNRKN